MAQPLQTLTISAPAFKGLNTQDSPVNADPNFAAVADNLVIDSYGRIGCRLGLQLQTTSSTQLNGQQLHVIHEYEDANGNLKYFGVGNAKILEDVKGTMLDSTPAAYTITDEDFKIINFNDNCYFFCRQHEPLVYSTSLGAVTKMSAVAGAAGTPPQAHEVLGAFGRLWAADLSGDKQTVYWSDLLSGHVWTGGTSGSINLDKAWVDGSDKIVALAGFNGNLVIFGSRSILIYQGADDPATMSLLDTINGVGCVDRNSVQHTGEDLVFLSHRGVMSLGRTIQEKSNPTRDLSRTVRDDLIAEWQLQSEPVHSVYSPVHRFYLLGLQNSNVVYCFDTRSTLEDGSWRATRWVTTRHHCFELQQDDTLLVGNTAGVSKYDGYNDNGATYQIRYYSNPLSFGDPSHLKFVKKIIPTVIGGSQATCAVKWSYDFKTNYRSQLFTISSNGVSYYNVDEYNNAYYSDGVLVSSPRINGTGSGNLITVGLESTINNAPISIQEYMIQITAGRTY